MDPATLSLLQNLSGPVLRLLEGLENEGHLRAGFVADLVGDLARERYYLAKSMLNACPAASEAATVDDLRTAVSRCYYACHHACRAALMSLCRQDIRGHSDVVGQMAVRAKKDVVWLRASKTVKNLLDRRHIADYDPYDPGGISNSVVPQSIREQILAIHSEARDVVMDVEGFLKNAGVIR